MEPLSKILRIAFFFFIAVQLTACGKDPLTNALTTNSSGGDEMLGQVSEVRTESLFGNILNDPTQGKIVQPLGFYSKGTLINASSLGNTGPGFFKLFLGRDTGWTSFDMTEIVKDAADMMTHDYPNREPLEIGDMSHQHGGLLFSHLSHQNGLDADIRYYSKNGHTQNPIDNGGFDEEFVSGGVITSNFDVARNFHIIHHIVETGRVVRIFTDPAIKTSLCAYGKKIGMTPDVVEILRRLIRYPNHANHFHLRITCPHDSPNCQSQVDVPAGSGC